MVFEEIEHVATDAFHGLPAVGKLCGRHVVALYASESVVEVYLVVEIIESAIFYEVAVERHVVYLGDEHYMGIAFAYVGYYPLPEFKGHHVGHVASETVNSHVAPVAQYGVHVVPCARYRVEMVGVVAVVDTVVELYSLVPVVLRRKCREAVVARGFGREFDICVIS